MWGGVFSPLKSRIFIVTTMLQGTNYCGTFRISPWGLEQKVLPVYEIMPLALLDTGTSWRVYIHKLEASLGITKSYRKNELKLLLLEIWL